MSYLAINSSPVARSQQKVLTTGKSHGTRSILPLASLYCRHGHGPHCPTAWLDIAVVLQLNALMVRRALSNETCVSPLIFPALKMPAILKLPACPVFVFIKHSAVAAVDSAVAAALNVCGASCSHLTYTTHLTSSTYVRTKLAPSVHLLQIIGSRYLLYVYAGIILILITSCPVARSQQQVIQPGKSHRARSTLPPLSVYAPCLGVHLAN